MKPKAKIAAQNWESQWASLTDGCNEGRSAEQLLHVANRHLLAFLDQALPPEPVKR